MAYYQDNQLTPSVNGYSFYNRESGLDKTMLAFNMWKTTIRVSIYPLIESENDDQVKFDRKGGISIYMTPTRAYEFGELIKRFKTDPEKYSKFGVSSGQQMISVQDPRFVDGFNGKAINPVIVIRKISPEGQLEASYAYEISDEYYGVVEDYDQNTGTFKKNYEEFKGFELDRIAFQLCSYGDAMANTYAFSVNEQNFIFLDKIANKLGVELLSSYGGSSYKSNSYFNTNDGSGFAGNSSTGMSGTSNSLASMI